jgi:hypothetical protein
MNAKEPNFAIGAPFQEMWEKFRNEVLPHVEPPPVLYHYTGVKGLVGIVKSNRLWASDVLFMNDSTEVRYGRDLIISEAKAAADRTASPVAQAVFKTVDKILYKVDDLVETFFAACFCEDGDLLSQWRGYAGRRGGYALGFRSDELGPRRT